MTFRHIALIKFKEGTSLEFCKSVVSRLQELPSKIPEIKYYSVGLDAGISPGNFNMAIVGDFEDQAGYQTYVTNADHQAVIEYFKPHIEARSAVQYDAS